MTKDKKYPTETYSHYSVCLCGCGKKSSNRSGYHKDCRNFICKACNEQSRWSGTPETLCLKCKRKKSHSDVRTAAHIGAIF